MCYIVRMPESLDLSRRHYDTASHTTSWKTVSRLCVWQWYPLLGRVGAWRMFSSHACQYVIQLVLVFLCEKVYFNPQTATLFPVIIHAKEDFQDSPNFGVCVCVHVLRGLASLNSCVLDSSIFCLIRPFKEIHNCCTYSWNKQESPVQMLTFIFWFFYACVCCGKNPWF